MLISFLTLLTLWVVVVVVAAVAFAFAIAAAVSMLYRAQINACRLLPRHKPTALNEAAGRPLRESLKSNYSGPLRQKHHWSRSLLSRKTELLVVSTLRLLKRPHRPKVAQRRHLLHRTHGLLDLFLPFEETLGLADQFENFLLLPILSRLSHLQEPPPNVPTILNVPCDAVGAQRCGKDTAIRCRLLNLVATGFSTRRRLHVQPQLFYTDKSLA